MYQSLSRGRGSTRTERGKLPVPKKRKETLNRSEITGKVKMLIYNFELEISVKVNVQKQQHKSKLK